MNQEDDDNQSEGGEELRVEEKSKEEIEKIAEKFKMADENNSVS